MIVLDTTVLIYAHGTDHPLQEPCAGIVAAIGDGSLDATTTIEVIQEFAHVRSRRRGRTDAAGLARAYVDLLEPLLVPEEKDLSDGLRLWEEHDQLGAFDSVLAAAALSVDATLVSADKAFATVPRLRHVVPDADGLKRLLAET